MRDPVVSVVSTPRATLGECPVWHPEDQRLWWSDIFGQRLHRLDPETGADAPLALPCRLNSFGFRAGGGLVAGTWTGFAFLDPLRVAVAPLWDLPSEQPGFFLNDGRCDPRGRFWAATVCETYDMPGAALYRLDPDGSHHRVVPGLLASNGLAFSPDGRTMYYADSVIGVVWAFDFDLDDGMPTGRRVFAKLHRPDGAAVDADGGYWVASFGAGEVIRFAPDGRLDRRIALPITQTAMCAFGGARLDTLFVTTGTFRLDPDEARRQELAGAVFAITGLGVCGLPEPRFAG